MASNQTIIRAIRTIAPVVSAVAPPLATRWLARLFTTPHKRPPLPREQVWLESAQRSVVSLNADIEVPVWSWVDEDGDGPDARSVVLLVHGWSGRGSQMGSLVAPLVERGFRVVAFDAPGHGDADGRFSAVPLFVDAMERIADTVGPVHGIIAHSLGTAAATMAVARGMNVERLVYLAPPEDLGAYLTRFGAFLGFGSKIPLRAHELLERRYDIRFAEARGSALAPGMDVPLLVIHDDTDTDALYAEGKFLAQCWPGARLLTTHGLGHRRIVRADEVVRAAADFLDGEGVGKLVGEAKKVCGTS